jgi:hypothetical protein
MVSSRWLDLHDPSHRHTVIPSVYPCALSQASRCLQGLSTGPRNSYMPYLYISALLRCCCTRVLELPSPSHTQCRIIAFLQARRSPFLKNKSSPASSLILALLYLVPYYHYVQIFLFYLYLLAFIYILLVYLTFINFFFPALLMFVRAFYYLPTAFCFVLFYFILVYCLFLFLFIIIPLFLFCLLLLLSM